MAVLLNSAGTSAADPILHGLGFEWVISPTTMDVATVVGAWIDTTAGIPGSTSATLSPLGNIIISGTTGSYNDTNKRLTISSTTGVSVGDYIYVSHGSITDQAVKIATIPAGGDVTMSPNPFNGGGNQTGISYQVAWRSILTAGTAPTVSSGGGQQNFYKTRLDDSVGNHGDLSESHYIRTAPSGSSYIAINSVSYTGLNRINTLTPTLNILSGWTNRGGIGTVALANHTGQGVNNFTFGDDTTAEKSLANALSSGLKVTAGDGNKYTKFIFRGLLGSSIQIAVDADVLLDTTAPGVSFSVYGR
jgi:hypothetical protein